MALAGIILAFSATDAYQLVVARALWGIGDAAFFCVSTAYVASVFPIRERGRALGVFVSIETIGSFLGQSFGGIVASVFTYRGVFAISIPLSAVVFSLLILFRGTHRLPSERVELQPTQRFRHLLTPTLVAACIIVLVVMFRNNGITSTILPLYFTNFLGISLPMYGLLIAFGTVGSTIGNFFGGWLSDKMDRVRIILLGILLLTLCTYLLSAFTTFTLLAMVMVLQGYAWGSMYSVTPVLILDSVPGELRGVAVGTYRTFFDLGGLLGPIFMSVVADALGFLASFYVGTAMVLSNLALIPFLQKKPRKMAEGA